MITHRSRRSLRQGVPAFGLTVALLFASGAAIADGGAEHILLQRRPIELGVSGSSIEHIIDKAFAYCYAGTLGSLVTDGTDDYILSNNHVLAKENEPDNVLAPDGYQIIQPGLLDEGSCSLSLGDPAHIVAYLTAWVEILFGKGKNLPENRVDAAIALTDVLSVDSGGDIRDIGPLSAAPVTAIVSDPRMRVQKSGRTTGRTFGTVEAVGVTINVDYLSGKARFVNQVRIRGICADFSTSGDSGSLIVNVPAGERRSAVGLLFAGGGADTFANPILTVLDEMGTEAGRDLSMVLGAEGPFDDTTAVPECADDGGADEPKKGKGPPSGRGVDQLGLEIALEVAAEHSAALLSIPGVVGHGVGADDSGEAVIEVYVENAARVGARRPIPREIEGIAVRVIETGPIRAY